MSDLPEGWEWVKLSDLANLINGDRGKNYPSKGAFVDVGMPFINAGHLQDNDIKLSEMNYISEEHFNRLSGGKIQQNDIVYCLRGSLGKSAIVRDIKKGAIASSLVIVRSLQYVETEYLFNFLISPLGKAEIYRFDNGSAQPNLSSKSLGEYRVPLAPLNEQKRIADKLDRLLAKVDACRERCDRIPLILKRFRQSVLAAAMSGELTEDWRSDRFNDSDFDLHSVAGKLGDFADVIDPNPSHRYPSYDEGIIPLLATEQMSGLNDWDLSTAKLTNFDFYQSRKLSHDFFNDDIIFARKGRLGLARKPPQNCRYVFSHTVFIVRAKINKIVPTYLLWFLRQEWCIDWLLREMNSNTGVPTLGKSFMIRLPIQVPSEPEQHEIVRRVEKLFAFADRLESRYQTARDKCNQLTPALLEKAFQGELVPQDLNDEPASVLLERIKAHQANTEANKPKRTTAKRKAKFG